RSWCCCRRGASGRACAGPAGAGLRRSSWWPAAGDLGKSASKPPPRQRRSRLAPASPISRCAPCSERPAQHDLVARARVLGLEFVFAVVAGELVAQGVELVEELVLRSVQQVGCREPYRDVPAEALLDE